MNNNPALSPRRLGSRLISSACALLTVFVLAALSVSAARADVVFTRSTVSAESWVHYTATFTPAYSGNYTLGFNLTAGGSSGDNSILIDAVQVTNGATTLFSDGFETPNLASNTGSGTPNGSTLTIGNWVCTNSSGILDGSPPNWGLSGQGLGSADGTTQYGFLQAVSGYLPHIKAASTLALVAGQTYTVSFYQASRRDFGGATTYTVTLDAPVPTVYASGLSAVTGWDPLFLDSRVVPDSLEGKPVPTIGYNDPRWANAHAAIAFPLGSHPWENIVPYNFSANWINAWAGGGQLNQNPGLHSNLHGKTSSSPGWAGYPYYGVPDQSFTKYSTSVYGQGEFVLQFLADNASWIYVDGALVGYQDYSWGTNGTGRYLITLASAGAHDLGFVIWDGGGLAGGKFRLETRASWEASNPGVTLPPRAATVSLSNLTHTYDGTPKAASVTTAPSGLTTSVTYNGSTTAPTNVGSYAVVATVTSAGYAGSTTGTLTIGKANATITLGNLTHTYDATAKSATATTSPAGLGVTFNTGNSFTNAGDYTVIASISNTNYNASTTSDTLHIAKAPSTTTTVGAGPFTYDGTTHTGGSGTVTGVGGVTGAATVTYSGDQVNAGSYTVTAHYAGDANHTASDGAPVTITINKATSATTTIGAGPFTYDGSTQSGGSGTAAGAGVLTGSTTLTYSGEQVNAGTYTVTAHYAGDGNHAASDGAPVTITINRATSATTTIGAGPFTYDGSTQSGGSGTVAGAGIVTGSTTLTYLGDQINAGTYTVTAHYAGDGNHTASDGAPVTITITQATSATTTVGAGPFTYDGTTQTGGSGTVAAAGIVTGSTTLTYSGDQINAGTYTVTAHYAGDANHTASDGAPVTITINKADATITVNGYTGTYDAAAHGATGSASGVGSVNLSAGLSLGSSFTDVPGGTASWSFAGGTNYNDASGTAAIVITKANAAITVNGYTGVYDDAAHGATGSASGVGGVNLSAGLNLGASFTNVPGGTASWSFAGGTNYNDASGTAAIVITMSATKTTLGAVPTVQAVGQPVTLTATVGAVAPGAGVPSGTVTFMDGLTVLGTSNVNAAGVAVLAPSSMAVGPHSITATYSGSSNHLTSGSNAVSILIYGYPTGGGTFAIGDGNASVGASVTFWGAQWEKTNALSGGASNASFKGFAVAPATPAVGTTFTAAPGNSAPSPASVPAYLGVIVTSKVTKSGSNITGTIVKLVVVKTNPGYEGDPGHAGTGTVVAAIP